MNEHGRYSPQTRFQTLRSASCASRRFQTIRGPSKHYAAYRSGLDSFRCFHCASRLLCPHSSCLDFPALPINFKQSTVCYDQVGSVLLLYFASPAQLSLIVLVEFVQQCVCLCVCVGHLHCARSGLSERATSTCRATSVVQPPLLQYGQLFEQGQSRTNR